MKITLEFHSWPEVDNWALSIYRKLHPEVDVPEIVGPPKPRIQHRVDCSNLSARARNALVGAGIVHIEDIRDMHDRELLLIPNLGVRSLREAKQYLERLDNEANAS